MGRMLNDDEESYLNDCMELVGVKSMAGLLDFVREHSAEHDLDFDDQKLRDAKMPCPSGKQRDIFILIVNEFTKFAHEQGTYPALPTSLNKKRLTLVIAEYTGASYRTSQTKIDQLVAVGWLENRYGNILNPVKTWFDAETKGKIHPGITSQSRDAQEDGRGGPSASSSSGSP